MGPSGHASAMPPLQIGYRLHMARLLGPQLGTTRQDHDRDPLPVRLTRAMADAVQAT